MHRYQFPQPRFYFSFVVISENSYPFSIYVPLHMSIMVRNYIHFHFLYRFETLRLAFSSNASWVRVIYVLNTRLYLKTHMSCLLGPACDALYIDHISCSFFLCCYHGILFLMMSIMFGCLHGLFLHGLILIGNPY